MTMKYLLDIGIQKEVQNENKIWHNLSVYKFETKIKKNTIFENANFTKLYNIINIEVSIWSWKFQFESLIFNFWLRS